MARPARVLNLHMRPSFEEVFDEEFVPLYRYLARRLGVAVAEEIAAEAFTIAYRRWESFDHERPVKPWIYGIAANLLRNHRRSERRMLRAYALRGRDPGFTEDHALATISEVDSERLARLLAAGLAELEPETREVLLLRAWAELSDAEIAEALSLPVGTVKSRLSRAREQLGNQIRAADK